MRQIFLSIAIILTSTLTAAAQTTSDDSPFTLEQHWNLPDAMRTYSGYNSELISSEKWIYSPFFIVSKDIIYFSSVNDNYKNHLLAVNGNDGSVIGLTEIDWGNFSHPQEYPSAFIGTDSQGNPYIASKAFQNASSDKPRITFHIFQLQLSENIARVIRKYDLPITKGTLIQNLDIFGDIEEGNFTVAAVSWDKSSYTKDINSRLMIWNAVNSSASIPLPQSISIKEYMPTVCMVRLLSNSSIAIHDRNIVDRATPGNNAEFKLPTIYKIDNGKLTKQSQISDTSLGIGAGMAFFSLAGKNLMVYSSAIEPYEFKISELADNYSFDNATDLFTVSFNDIATQWDSHGGFDVELNQSPVFIEKDPDGQKANIYMAGGKDSGMAKYVLTAKDQTVTGIENIIIPIDTKPAYYDLTGRRLAAPPAHGLYLIRTPTATTKHLRP